MSGSEENNGADKVESSQAARDEAFKQIKEYFESADRALHRKGKLPLGSTAKGFWGVAHLDDVYDLFKRIELQKKERFLDLGSGDGRVALVAALFTEAHGIEYDEALHNAAVAAAQELKIARVRFIQDDYSRHNLSEYPALFTYADHNFKWLEEKKHELTPNHTIYLYHDTFHPHFLEKGKIIWIGQIPVFQYTLPRGS